MNSSVTFFLPFVLEPLWAPLQAPGRVPASLLLWPADWCYTFSDHRSSRPTRRWDETKLARLLSSSKFLVQLKPSIWHWCTQQGLFCAAPPKPREEEPRDSNAGEVPSATRSAQRLFPKQCKPCIYIPPGPHTCRS